MRQNTRTPATLAALLALALGACTTALPTHVAPEDGTAMMSGGPPGYGSGNGLPLPPEMAGDSDGEGEETSRGGGHGYGSGN